ncbi:hypothetical protein AAFF_G00203810 [Aldrovandia affinis]|uniref:RNA helicase n=1 Tax=Aldrovandia affinis TaxID=143900 RepID=A0AAD7WVE1_9TELE|nr:hypothetical protein AAFF_G00203810 [Aldrovandia affinis]
MAASMKKAAHDIQKRRRTDDVLLSEGIDFSSLLLSQPVQDGLTASGFQKPSPIQLKAIPLGRCGLDLIVQAKSGTGKTCVFATIALDSLIVENLTTQVLVLAPTREIAVQIHSVVMAIGSALEGLECHVFIGGTPVSQDKAHLKKCHIAIGSPGRVKQLIELGLLLTASIRLFVLDEADKLLEEGSFQDQINWIYSSLPVNKQMLALSATYPESLAQHLARYMRDPTFVRLNPTDPGLIGLKQYYRLVKSHPLPHKIFEEKVQQLFELFSKVPFNQALVFSNLHTRAQHLANILTAKGLPAACISGGLSQDQRLEAMSKLKQYQCRVLISTDLTSRGIDADKVNLVINLDIPQDWETYMHRIGRAGRLGTHGLAVTFCCHGEEENKMMAIAQKCSLSLLLLPDPIPPGLMEEPSDWDVTIENLQTQPAFEAAPLPDKKKRMKTAPVLKHSRHESPRAAENVLERGASKRPGETSLGPGEGPNVGTVKQPKKAAPILDAPVPVVRATPVPEAPTRRELQEALPKIPPLPSFKPRVATALHFEDLAANFEWFMAEGPGREVEFIRRFTGPDNDGNSGSYEERCGSPSPKSRSVSPAPSSEVSSPSDGLGDGAEDLKPPSCPMQTGLVERRATSPSQTSRSSSSTPSASSPRGAGQPARKPKSSSADPEKTRGGKRGRKATSESSEEPTETSHSEYWQAYYRAWGAHYASMPQQYQQYQQYQQDYHTAYSWMAAYRMNSIYMEELMKR